MEDMTDFEVRALSWLLIKASKRMVLTERTVTDSDFVPTLRAVIAELVQEDPEARALVQELRMLGDDPTDPRA